MSLSGKLRARETGVSLMYRESTVLLYVGITFESVRCDHSNETAVSDRNFLEVLFIMLC